MMKKREAISGECLCGSIKYELLLPIICINNCHCSRCRKASGAAFGSFLHTNLISFNWTKGEDSIQTYRPNNGDPRPFCKNCGSRVPSVDKEEDHVIVPVGTLNGNPMSEPIANIYVDSKADWYSITDSIVQYSEHAPDEFWEPYLEKFSNDLK